MKNSFVNMHILAAKLFLFIYFLGGINQPDACDKFPKLWAKRETPNKGAFTSAFKKRMHKNGNKLEGPFLIDYEIKWDLLLKKMLLNLEVL